MASRTYLLIFFLECTGTVHIMSGWLSVHSAGFLRVYQPTVVTTCDATWGVGMLSINKIR